MENFALPRAGIPANLYDGDALLRSRCLLSSRPPRTADSDTKKCLRYRGRRGAISVAIPSAGAHRACREKVSGASRRTIWSRAYYSALIQSRGPWLNKSTSFPRESATLRLFFPPISRLRRLSAPSLLPSPRRPVSQNAVDSIRGGFRERN